MTRPHLLTFSTEVKKTVLQFRELHAASAPELLNEEWMILENTSPNSMIVRGCQLTLAVNMHRRPQLLGMIEPGFVLEAGGKVRLVTGTAARKAQGAAPTETEDLKNYHLFLKEPVLSEPGVVVRLTLRQLDLARAAWAPDQPGGVDLV